MLIVSGVKDNEVSLGISDVAHKLQLDNPGATEFVGVPGRGHALTIDSGWREVAIRATAMERTPRHAAQAHSQEKADPLRALQHVVGRGPSPVLNGR
jgi:hypothetical protein